MAAFLKTSEKPLDKNPAFEMITDAAKKGSGRGDTSLLGKASSTVGATGDNAANNTNNSAKPKADYSVGATGDNAAKKGSGK